MRMITSVSERGRSVATFRYISVWMMETAARWTPITPEMEAKVMMGRRTGNMPRWPTRWASVPSSCGSRNSIR